MLLQWGDDGDIFIGDSWLKEIIPEDMVVIGEQLDETQWVSGWYMLIYIYVYNIYRYTFFLPRYKRNVWTIMEESYIYIFEQIRTNGWKAHEVVPHRYKRVY